MQEQLRLARKTNQWLGRMVRLLVRVLYKKNRKNGGSLINREVKEKDIIYGDKEEKVQLDSLGHGDNSSVTVFDG